MLRCIFTDPPHMGLDNIVPVQKRHFSVRLHPDLILCMLGNMVERSDMELELSSFGKLPKTCPKGEEVIASDRGRKLRNGLADVVDTVALDTEAVRVVGAVNQVGDIAANVVCQFLEQALGFDVGERTHGWFWGGGVVVVIVGVGGPSISTIFPGLGFFFLSLFACGSAIGRVTLCAPVAKFFFGGESRVEVAAAFYFILLVFFLFWCYSVSARKKKGKKKKKKDDTMVVSKRKQDKTSGHPVASKKPKSGKELEKPKSAASTKDVELKKSKKPAKPLPKRTVLSAESDSDELGDDEDGALEIKDDGSEGEAEAEAEEDSMDIDQPSKENGDGQSGCEWS